MVVSMSKLLFLVLLELYMVHFMVAQMRLMLFWRRQHCQTSILSRGSCIQMWIFTLA